MIISLGFMSLLFFHLQVYIIISLKTTKRFVVKIIFPGEIYTKLQFKSQYQIKSKKIKNNKK